MDDLISRSMVLGMFEHECCSECTGCKYEDKERLYPCGLIKHVPIVDAVPVVHGRWIEKRWTTDYDWGLINHRALVCTACSVEIADGEETPYCPYCGAKMDLEE